jgi:GDPmannose 4,6-dehydratase
MKALIFGASGQDGHYLAQICRTNGVETVGVSRSGIGVGETVAGDVSDFDQVEALVRDHAPQLIFHLAANSTTRHTALFENHATIAIGVLNVLEAVYRHRPETKVFITGSGVQFVNQGQPISERDDFDPGSAYAVARIQSVYAARYFRRLGVRNYVGYLFHHESPLRKDNHVSQMIVRAVQRIANGSREILEIGDMSVEKEWVFAGDVAQAIFDLTQQDEVTEATIGSGRTHTIQDWLETCFGLIDRDWRNHVQLRPGFTPEYNRLVSDPTTIHSLGWRPQMDLTSLARLMLASTAPPLC